MVAAEAGADFIGLVFVPGRPRRIDIPTASAIVAGVKSKTKSTGENSPRVVGLFAGQPLEEVNRTIDACGLDLAQLCGDESLEYCGDTKSEVIKVIHIPGSLDPPGSEEQTGGGAADLDSLAARVQDHTQAGILVTLDRQVAGVPGGTGESFDWTIGAGLSRRGHAFILAGGLSPENVSKAIDAVQPWGVDVSSGVETGGMKDPEKIRSFIRNARSRD